MLVRKKATFWHFNDPKNEEDEVLKPFGVLLSNKYVNVRDAFSQDCEKMMEVALAFIGPKSYKNGRPASNAGTDMGIWAAAAVCDNVMHRCVCVCVSTCATHKHKVY